MSAIPQLALMCSNETLLVQEYTDKLRQQARSAGYSEREVYTVAPHFDWRSLIVALQSGSLFGDKKIIELRIPTGKPGVDGAKVLNEMVQWLSEDILVIITLPRMDKTSKNSVWFKNLAQAAGRHAVDFPDMSIDKLPRWIAERMAAHQQSTTPDALRWMAQQLEGNLLAAHQEVEKLALLHPAGDLSEADVQACVLNVARYDVFGLMEAVLTGDAARVARMLDGLRAEGAAAPLLIWSITEEIRTLYTLQQGVAERAHLPTLMKQNRVWGAREQLIPRALPKLPLTYLRQLLTRCAQLDRMVKGLDKFDPWLASLSLCCHMARRIRA